MRTLVFLLERHMVRRIRAWLAPDTRFVVLRDQDAGDCRAVRRALVERAAEAQRPDTLVRVACRDLESWILGDLRALAEAFDLPGLEKLAAKAKYRDPDSLHHGVEEIRALVGAYQKRDGARRVGRLLVPERNQSRSFRAFCQGLARLVASPSS